MKKENSHLIEMKSQSLDFGTSNFAKSGLGFTTVSFNSESESAESGIKL